MGKGFNSFKGANVAEGCDDSDFLSGDELEVLAAEMEADEDADKAALEMTGEGPEARGDLGQCLTDGIEALVEQLERGEGGPE